MFAAAPQVRTQAPGFYRMMLGDFEITALPDGTHPFPDAEVLTKAGPGVNSPRSRLFDNNPNEASALLAASDLKVATEGSINAFLVNSGKKLVLIDSGAGTLRGVYRKYACCGYRPEQIDYVFLTYLHADHAGRIAPADSALRMVSGEDVARQTRTSIERRGQPGERNP